MDKVNFSEWLELREEKDACYHKVKRRYKVWPSAYACVPTKTSKALTKEGWKHYEELSVGDEILTYSMAKDSLEFQPIKNLYSYQDAETYVVQNGNKGLKFECTPNHKWVVKYNSCKENIGTKKYTDLVNDMRLVTTEELLADSESNGKLVISSNYSDDNIVELENFNLIEERKADVWCPETDNGTWLMMQENDGHEIITITGNSGALVRCRKVGAKNWGISENVDKIAIRYVHEDGRGLMNNSSLNYDKLDDEEYSDVEDEYLGLSQPPSDLHNKKIVFAFTPEGEQKHNRLIELLSKASKKGVRREVLDLSDYQIEWQSGDGQLGLKKLRNQRDEFHEGTFDLEKERGLRGWFDRNKGKGWIDCKASKKGHLVPCGRKKAGKGTERKYPACRPTLSACNKSKHKKKTSKAISWKTKSESRLDELNWKSLLASSALLAGAGNAGAADPIHHFSGEELVPIGQSEKKLETDERFIKSWTMIKETITNKIKKNPNIRFLHIEVILEHHQGKKTAVVSLSAEIQAEDEQLAKQILIREVTRSAAEVGLQGEAIRGLKKIFVNSSMSNESMGSIFKLKLIITPQTAFWRA